MSASGVLLPVCTTGLMIAACLVPRRWAERNVRRLREAITGLAALHLGAAAWALLSVVAGPSPGARQLTLFEFPGESPLTGLIYLDGVSAVMLTLVGFVGWVICRYSIRNLDGDTRQGQYFLWTALTIGAVSLLVISGNLLLLMVGWSLMSVGIHRLLLHNPERVAARRAAWTKFACSRFGDLCLIAALVIIYRAFHTLDLPALFEAVAAGAGRADGDGGLLSLVTWLLVIGAAAKSAQFPLHTWLPETMEAPTPVSALMHAGIVNAGGYFLIRTSPLLMPSSAALPALACLGAFTACFGAVVMHTQPSIKRSLAYSTIAQMGFMMLQCGLGAFSAALLHIVAHSLYKAHAFLSSGSVLTEAAGLRRFQTSATPVRSPLVFACAAVIPLAIYAVMAWAFGLNPTQKPGGYLLGFIYCIGLSQWVARSLLPARVPVVATSLAVTTLLTAAYVIGFLTFDKFVSVTSLALTAPAVPWGIAVSVAAGFGLLAFLDSVIVRNTHPRWFQALYVHAANGFYVEALVRRAVRVANL